MKKTGFLAVEKIYLPIGCLNSAFSELYQAGLTGTEGVSLFVGVQDNERFHITDVYQPIYIANSVEEGLYYAITTEEIYRLNKWLYAEKKKLIAQIHSHPGLAYHSEADDAYSIVGIAGGLSLVVPDFATGRVAIDRCAVYRLSEDNVWERMENEAVNRLIKIV
jgi:proteasome lid subunit RPN8/RPN11